MALTLALAACGGRPAGVLVPVATQVPGTTQVSMLVATTRAKATNTDMFSGERGKVPSFAEITVSIPPDAGRQVGEVQWPKSVPGNPQTDFVVSGAQDMTLPEAKTWFNRDVKKRPQRQVLVFIHGYNNRFDDAVFRFAQIIHDSGADVTPILFTWPSRGSLLAYGYDRESAVYSRDALENLLTALAKDPNVGEVSVLAHSMGNWVTFEALRQMAIRNGRVLPKIKNVMLAAPDVDVDIFQSQWADLGTPTPNVTVFVSQDDRALKISQRVWGSQARLGQVNPELEPYKSEFEARKINVFDLTSLKTSDGLNHGKFAESPDVVKLIGTRIATQPTITDSREGVGDRIVQVTTGAATTVGHAAGMVLSAPVAVVDANTRDNLSAQAEQLGGTVNGTMHSTTGLLTTAPSQ
ncbi:esterase [Azorhizobium oxalatiphilum]|uniref:Esterase n=2 Tax=Azorhizobium oxalatiphilum TaxID=980631 RepID=A0A917C694_9HYPH|nr:alpha/beta hydrolase [Azorhizobium oxalatiphilum]GGF72054.1 esterase [Azorhizobium oxalatiphilum]